MKFSLPGIVLTFIIISSYLVLPACKEEQGGDRQTTLFQPQVLGAYKDTIQRQVHRVMLLNKLNSSDLDKIIFSETLSPDQNSDLWFYNKEKIGNTPMRDDGMQESYSKFMDAPELIFTMGNKITGKGTEKSDLVVIFPRVKDETCNFYKDKYGEVEAVSINFQPSSAEVSDGDIMTLSQEEGCVTINSVNYYYGLLVER